MATRDKVNWWHYRRSRWLAIFAALLVTIIGVQVFRTGGVDLVIYNDGANPLGPLRAVVGGVAVEFPALTPRESQMRALPASVMGELTLWLPTEPPQRVAGPWVNAREAVQIVARIDDGGNVAFSVMPSWRVRMADWLR